MDDKLAAVIKALAEAEAEYGNDIYAKELLAIDLTDIPASIADEIFGIYN